MEKAANVIMVKLEKVVNEQATTIEKKEKIWLFIANKIQEFIEKKALRNEQTHPVLPLLVDRSLEKSLLLSFDEMDAQSDTTSESSIAQTMLDSVNNERMSRGYVSYRMDQTLNDIAQQHADWMNANLNCSLGQLTHNQNGQGPAERATNFGYDWRAIGENVACGQDNVAETMKQWMNSAPHKKNILDQDFEEIGIGFAGEFWVQVFGAKR